jgi:hypothetical protein
MRKKSAGRWKAFGHLELRVDDPPHWQTDYLVDVTWEREYPRSD